MMTKKKSSKSDAMHFLDDLIGEELTVGSLLVTIRETDGLTLDALAKKLGVSRANLCDIEKGRKGVSPDRAARWARALGYPEAQFIALALQHELDAAGLAYKVAIKKSSKKAA